MNMLRSEYKNVHQQMHQLLVSVSIKLVKYLVRVVSHYIFYLPDVLWYCMNVFKAKSVDLLDLLVCMTRTVSILYTNQLYLI